MMRSRLVLALIPILVLSAVACTPPTDNTGPTEEPTDEPDDTPEPPGAIPPAAPPVTIKPKAGGKMGIYTSPSGTPVEITSSGNSIFDDMIGEHACLLRQDFVGGAGGYSRWEFTIKDGDVDVAETVKLEKANYKIELTQVPDFGVLIRVDDGTNWCYAFPTYDYDSDKAPAEFFKFDDDDMYRTYPVETEGEKLEFRVYKKK